MQTLISDLDGVVRLWPSEWLIAAEEQSGLPPGLLFQTFTAPEMLMPAITGEVTYEEWNDRVGRRLRAECPDADVALAVRLWSEPSGVVNEPVLDLIRQARSRCRVVLLTNATTRLMHDLKVLGLVDEFDHIVNSALVGYAKPDEAIFHAALEVAGATPAETVFVDDTQVNVEGASRLGIHSHLYRDTNELRHFLIKCGVIIS